MLTKVSTCELSLPGVILFISWMMTLRFGEVERLVRSHTAKEMAEPQWELGSKGLRSPLLSSTALGGDSATGTGGWSVGWTRGWQRAPRTTLRPCQGKGILPGGCQPFSLLSGSCRSLNVSRRWCRWPWEGVVWGRLSLQELILLLCLCRSVQPLHLCGALLFVQVLT